MLAPDWPPSDDDIRDALLVAWRDGSWGKYCSGHVERLEGAIATLAARELALTCASGTLAVEAALRAAGCGPGTEVVLAAYDYGGNFLSAHTTGAMPVLVDVSLSDLSPLPEAIEAALTERTRAVVVSHLHGGAAPMREIMRLCAGRAVVVEDAAQCPGAVVQGRPAGGWGDIGVFSFGGSKLLSAGRGGALVTSDGALAQRARLFLGRGNNLVAPLSELQAVVLLPQLARLAERNARRLLAVSLLRELLPPGLRLFAPAADGSVAAYYKVGLHLDEAAFGLPRARLVAAARARGIALDEGFRALHVGRAASRFRAAGPLDTATAAHRNTLVLHHPILLAPDEAIQRLASELHASRRD
jgi:dTDP-4-amino-4,6-dideoxygalactose transaminase